MAKKHSSTKYHVKRLIALFLVCAMTVNLFPSYASAKKAENKAQEPGGTVVQEKVADEAASEEVQILAEDESRRDETTKHFVLSDGRRRAVKYSQPVHYETENGWEDIDNTLEYDETSKTYENTSGSFHVQFSEESDSDTLLTIEKEGNTFAWKYVSQTDVKTQQVHEAGSDWKQKIHGKAKKRERKKPDTEYEEYTQNVQDGLEYENIDRNCDIEYTVTGSGVKEDIVLSTPTGQNEFLFEIMSEGLTLVKNEDGSISVIKKEIENQIKASTPLNIVKRILGNLTGESEEEEIFYIPAPFMYDSNEGYSDAVAYEIEASSEGKQRLKIVADKEWLSDAERVYPVTIDPMITTKRARSDIDSTFIANGTNYKNTNFGAYRDLYIGWETQNYGHTRTLVKFSLPSLNKGDMVVGASLGLFLYKKSFYTSSMEDQQINAHVVTESWNKSTVTWNTQPEYDSIIYDYDYIKKSDKINETYKMFDITKAVKGWYEGNISNYGILIKQYIEGGEKADTAACGAFWSEKYNELTDVYPSIWIDYRNNKGLENYWSYTTVTAGAAGTAYVNDYSGNLVFEMPLTGSNSERMPLSLSMIYNGYQENIKYTSGKNKSYKTTPGRGWKLNVQQTVIASTEYGLTGEEAEKYPFVYTDGDGTEHYFKKKSYDPETKKYVCKDEDGLDFTLTNKPDITATYQITDKNDGVMYFNAKGNLFLWKDANGNQTRVTWKDTDGDGTVDKDKIEKITDATGHTYTFTYSTESDGTEKDYIKKITDNAGRAITWSMDGEGCVTQITYSDGTKTTISYEETYKYLKSVTDNEGYEVRFGYTSAAKGRRVNIVREVGNGSSGQRMTFDRSSYNTTIVRTAGNDGIHYDEDSAHGNDDIITIYQFDNLGRTVSQQVKYGSGMDVGAGAYSYTSDAEDETTLGKKNKVSDKASLGKNTVNLLGNGNAERMESWATSTGSGTTGTISLSSTRYLGNKAFCIDVTSMTKSSISYMSQVSSGLTVGNTYTLSAYVRTSAITRLINQGGAYGAYLQLAAFNSAGTRIGNAYSEFLTSATASTINSGFRRLSVSLVIPQGTTTVRSFLCMKDSKGTAWFDAIQLEQGSVANDFNMLENSSFEIESGGMPTKWTTGSVTYLENSSGTVVNGVTTTGKKDGSKSMRIKGEGTASKGIGQTVPISWNENDTYIVSGWAAAHAAPCRDGHDASFEIRVKVNYRLSNGTTVSQNKKPAKFNTAISGWQYTSIPVVLKYEGGESGETYTPTSLFVMCRYDHQANHAVFDHIQLIREPVQTYIYDSDGNVTSVKANAEQKENMTYDGADLKTYTDAAGYTSKYNYDSKHNLSTAITAKGNVTEYFYNNYGLVTSVENRNSFYRDKATAIIKTDKTYTSTDSSSGVKEGAYIKSQTDAHGNATNYTYDMPTGKVKSVTDANANVTTYAYTGNYEKLKSVTSGTSRVNYSYLGNRLSSIVVAGTESNAPSETYSFTYDNFGNTTATKVGNVPLTTNTYKTKNGALETSIYGNGDGIKYLYNNLGQVSYIYRKQDTSSTFDQYSSYFWLYDSDGTTAVHQDGLNQIKYVYCYDSIGRLIRQSMFSTVSGAYKGAIEFQYDNRNNLTMIKSELGGRTLYQSYSYSETDETDSTANAKDNLPTRYMMFSNRYIDYSYDGLNRLTKKKFRLGTAEEPVYVENAYYYFPSDRGEKYVTSQIKKETIGGIPYSYTYDKLGNITSIQKNYAAYQSYQYDNMSQLTRENNAVTDTTSTWTYDSLGNIASKNEYDYTTESTLQTPKKTVNYVYSKDPDAGWNQLLTGLEMTVTNEDGTTTQTTETIDYDAIGNPTTYRGASLGWFGRQMTSYSKDGTSISNTYDVNGIRGTKTVNGAKTTYTYVNGKLLYEARGDGKELHYYFDSYDHLAYVRVHQEDTYNSYYATTNAQGDVVSFYDASGNKLAAYEYDAWGNATIYKVTQVNGEDVYTELAANEEHIGNINPIRYRGYYYDTDMGLYYLQSRYYDAEVGRFINADTEEVLTGTVLSVYDSNFYAYCDNNPTGRLDDEGDFWNIVAGAIIGTTINVAVQVVDNVISGEDWHKGLVVAAVGGAITGGMTATGAGVLAQTVVGGVVAAGSDIINQASEKGIKNVNWKVVALSGALGAACTMLSGNGFRYKTGKVAKQQKVYDYVVDGIKNRKWSGEKSGKYLDLAAKKLKDVIVKQTFVTSRWYTIGTISYASGKREFVKYIK